MCSQPPRDVDDGWILDEIADCIELLDPATEAIGFTGGEPLLEWRRLVALLASFRDRLPETALHVLTNGRAFASDEVASSWAAVGHKRLSVGIPLYSAVDYLHDYVVQARGAFDETVLGILRLKDKGQRVEVRVVLHGTTTPRLRQTCAWLARNLPFVDHVALMGLENTGFALANQALLWIDPLDYRADLACGVEILRAAGVTVSIYNLPLCVLDRSVWDVAVQSISDWKNVRHILSPPDLTPACLTASRSWDGQIIRQLAAGKLTFPLMLGYAPCDAPYGSSVPPRFVLLPSSLRRGRRHAAIGACYTATVEPGARALAAVERGLGRSTSRGLRGAGARVEAGKRDC
jgi:His-Xaa-Ser system radical SAM maturase HxsC